MGAQPLQQLQEEGKEETPLATRKKSGKREGGWDG